MEVNNKKTSRLILDQWRRVAIISVLLLLMLISFLMINRGLSKDPTVKDLLYSYNISNNINYKVNLNENSFFDEKYLDMNKIYTASLIKNIETTFYYNYSNSNNLDLTYNYKIEGNIIGNYGEDTDQLWSKSFTLILPVVVENTNTNLININQPLDIDFNYYKNISDEFISQLHLSIEAVFDIKMTIELKSLDGTLDKTEVIEMKIPLTESTFKIVTSYSQNDQSSVFNTNIEEKPIDSSKVLLGSVLLTICLIVFMLTFRSLFAITKKSQYQIKLNKLLKRYGEIIVEVTNKINIDGLSIVDVKSIEDMIDIEEELHIPILYYEIKENEEGWFVINKENQLFRLKLKSETTDDAISNSRYKRAKATKIVEKLAPVLNVKDLEVDINKPKIKKQVKKDIKIVKEVKKTKVIPLKKEIIKNNKKNIEIKKEVEKTNKVVKTKKQVKKPKKETKK